MISNGGEQHNTLHKLDRSVSFRHAIHHQTVKQSNQRTNNYKRGVLVDQCIYIYNDEIRRISIMLDHNIYNCWDIILHLHFLILWKYIVCEWGTATVPTVIRYTYHYYFTIMIIVYCKHGWGGGLFCSFVIIQYHDVHVLLSFGFVLMLSVLDFILFPALFLLSHFLYF